MSPVSLPVTRPVGKALLVASAQAQSHPTRILSDLGCQYAVKNDPYAAMAELCRRPLAYQSLILWLGSVYRPELSIIRAVKRRFPHLEIWLGDTDHHAAALAEAMRLGADGLLDDKGLHRAAMPAAPAWPPAARESIHAVDNPADFEEDEPPTPPSSAAAPPADEEQEPILTSEELKPLLHGPG